MSMLGLANGEQGSYLDLADEMLQRSGDDDIEQLLRRICFSYAFNNTDDHMKNHGLLLEDGRWRLSPLSAQKSRPTAPFGTCGRGWEGASFFRPAEIPD